MSDVHQSMFDVGMIVIVVLLSVIAWLRADPNRKQRAAAWLASGWVLPSAAFFGYLSSLLGIWSQFMPLIVAPGGHSWVIHTAAERYFPSPHLMIFGGPLIALVWRVAVWGWIPALLLPRLDLRLVYGLGVLADELLLHFSLLSAPGSLRAVVFHAAVTAACMLPAQYFSRWTRGQNYLPVRVWMHFIFHSTLLLGVVSMAILSLRGGFGAPFARSSVINKLLLQLVLIPGVLLASAMREFYFGGGTPMPADAPLKLVDTGPYAYVANPMQIGKFGVLVAWAIFWASPAIFAAAVFSLLYSLTIASPREEREMLARFGSQWARYRKEVRRWWPRWRPYTAGANSLSTSGDARLYLDGNCAPCAELVRWFTRQRPVGLQVLPIPASPAGRLGTMTYTAGDGGREEQGIRALGRGCEHVNLFWAFVAWLVMLPVMAWLAQLIADVVTVGSRTVAMQACFVEASPLRWSNHFLSQGSSSQNGVRSRRPEPIANLEKPPQKARAWELHGSLEPRKSPKQRTSTEPMVWAVTGLSAVLLFLVCVFLFWKGSTSEMIWQLQHGRDASRFDAAYELARRGRTAIAAAPALKDALQDPDIRIQTIAADALLRMGAWPQLRSSDWMRKADLSAITAAMTDVANTFPPPQAALPVLENVLRNHQSADIRAQAVFTLAQYGAQAIPALEDALQDSDLSVRTRAQAVLQRIESR